MPNLFKNLKNYLFSLSIKQTLSLIFLLAFLITIPLTVYAVSTQRFDIRKKAVEPKDPITILNNQLISAGQAKQPFLLKRGRISGKTIQEVVLERKKILLEEIKTDPKFFLQHILPVDIRQALLKELNNQELLEQEVSLEGKIEALHFDDFEKKRSERKYKIDKYNLHLTKDIPHLISGSTIKVKGLALDKELVVENRESENFDIITGASLLPTTGEQKIAVIMFRLLDNPREPITEEELRSVIITAPDSLKNYYRENSLDKLSFSADIFGYYTIPYNDVDCSYYSWAEAADAAAREGGVPIDEYPRRIYVFWGNSCSYAAWATIGGNPSRYWMTARSGPTRSDSYLHEMGHNLGLWHACTLDCGDKTLGDFSSDFSDCVIYEYCDYYDVMGSSADHNHFNSASKSFLRWFSADQIKIISNTGIYTLTPLEVASIGTKALMIPIPDSDKYYYISYRQLVGFDSNLPPGIIRGATIHIWKNPSYPCHSLLIDTTPDYKETPHGYYKGDFSDSALSDQASFNDEVHGVTITQLSHDENSVTISVDLPLLPSPSSSPFPTPSPLPEFIFLLMGWESSNPDLDLNKDGVVNGVDFGELILLREGF